MRRERKTKDSSGVRAPPPLFFIGIFIIGYLLHSMFSIQFLPSLTFIGWIFIIISGILVISAFRVMRNAGTPTNVKKPTKTIVTNGMFQYTRNPMMLSLFLFYVGIAILLNTFWPIILLPVLIVIVTREIIDREERYLEQKFGKQYLQYKKKVRRWI